MNDETWFEEVLGRLGFSLTPTMCDPDTFSPKKGILYTYTSPNRLSTTIRMRTYFTPELANDLHAWGHTHDDIVNDLRELIVESLERELIMLGLPNPFNGPIVIDFTPSKQIPKFKL